MKKQALVPKDRVYKMTRGAAPLSFTLPSRNTRRYPLLWYDEENNINRALRYAVNQKSPFEDEQDGNAILEPVIFTDGFLSVPKTNPVLQAFLSYHPLNGISFVEVDNEKDAVQEIQELSYEVDALIEAKQLEVEHLEVVYRVLFGKDPTKISTAELRRDILVYAKRDPKGFLNSINDPMMKFISQVHLFFEKSLLTFRNNNKEVWFNTSSNKKKMLTVPYGEDPYETVALYLKSDEGLDALTLLENNAK
jgi:hypothetical protein